MEQGTASADNRAKFATYLRDRAARQDCTTTGSTRRRVFTSSEQITLSFATHLPNTPSGSAASSQCQSPATAFDVVQETINAENGNCIPGPLYITDPISGTVVFGSNGEVPLHSIEGCVGKNADHRFASEDSLPRFAIRGATMLLCAAPRVRVFENGCWPNEYVRIRLRAKCRYKAVC